MGEPEPSMPGLTDSRSPDTDGMGRGGGGDAGGLGGGGGELETPAHASWHSANSLCFSHSLKVTCGLPPAGQQSVQHTRCGLISTRRRGCKEGGALDRWLAPQPAHLCMHHMSSACTAPTPYNPIKTTRPPPSPHTHTLCLGSPDGMETWAQQGPSSG